MSLRLLQIGLGSWGLDWATRVVARSEAVSQAGYIVRSRDRAAATRDALGCEASAIFDSIDEAVRCTHADALLITTGTDGHSHLIREALDAGLHVLVEKPFAPSVEDARALVQLAQARGRVLMVNQNFRYFPAPRCAAELVRSQVFGRLNGVSIDFRRSAARGDAARGDWISRQPQPLLFDLGIHHFDLMRMIIGSDAASVACSAWKPASSRFVDPSSAAALICFDGVTASWAGSWEAPGTETPYSGNWRLDCEGAEIRWTCRGDRDLTLDADEVVIVEGDQRRTIPLDKSGAFGRSAVLEAFVAAIHGRSDDPYLPLASDNLASLELTLAAVEASRTHRTVVLAN